MFGLSVSSRLTTCISSWSSYTLLRFYIRFLVHPLQSASWDQSHASKQPWEARSWRPCKDLKGVMCWWFPWSSIWLFKESFEAMTKTPAHHHLVHSWQPKLCVTKNKFALKDAVLSRSHLEQASLWRQKSDIMPRRRTRKVCSTSVFGMRIPEHCINLRGLSSTVGFRER